ncbi:MAG TPA: hypothetical protein VFR19_06120, partial [Hyphomicrobiaceae bacterium]|nr:hypothetical protein [Hyphomicrobiaceae bacterium]
LQPGAAISCGRGASGACSAVSIETLVSLERRPWGADLVAITPPMYSTGTEQQQQAFLNSVKLVRCR